jgi:hypothetical protein
VRDPIQSLLTAIERDEGGIAIVWCPDSGLRDWLVDEVESLAPAGIECFRTSTVEAALTEPNGLVLLVPNNERDVVLNLDGSRDRLRNEERPRTQPIVLFLLRGGDGQEALAKEAIALGSWVGGSDTDPEELSQIDLTAEREIFEGREQLTPEVWLARWRSGQLPRTSANFRIAYRASLLVEP